MAPTASERLHLPSGRVVRVSYPTDAPPSPEGSLAALRALERGPCSLADPQGSPVAVGALRIDDFQVIRAFLAARGALDDPEIARPCSNCGHPLRVRPCQALELAPFLHGDLAHPELDAPFPHGDPLPIAPVQLRDGEATELVLRAVTVDEARPLLEAPPGGRVTAAMVRAMGVVRLGPEGHPGRIARALQRCSDQAWGDLASWVDQAWYPPRLSAWVRCEPCGARSSFEAPASKEFPADEAPQVDEPFPSFADFSARVEAHARQVFRRSGLAGVGLFVEEGPAACDEGGAALLGSYDPPVHEDHGVIGQPPEVRLYYRTFRAMHDEDGPYDLDAEIIETLEHELDHHRSFLGGHDPQDDDERAEIVDETLGRLGETEALRQASRSARQGVGDFFARTWPLWLLCALVALLEAWTAGR